MSRSKSLTTASTQDTNSPASTTAVPSPYSEQSSSIKTPEDIAREMEGKASNLGYGLGKVLAKTPIGKMASGASDALGRLSDKFVQPSSEGDSKETRDIAIPEETWDEFKRKTQTIDESIIAQIYKNKKTSYSAVENQILYSYYAMKRDLANYKKHLDLYIKNAPAPSIGISDLFKAHIKLAKIYFYAEKNQHQTEMQFEKAFEIINKSTDRDEVLRLFMDLISALNIIKINDDFILKIIAKIPPQNKEIIRPIMRGVATVFQLNNNYEAAIKLLEDFEIKADISFAGSYFNIGVKSLKSDNKYKALSYLEKAFELNPENHDYRNALMKSYYQSGNYSKALTTITPVELTLLISAGITGILIAYQLKQFLAPAQAVGQAQPQQPMQMINQQIATQKDLISKTIKDAILDYPQKNKTDKDLIKSFTKSFESLFEMQNDDEEKKEVVNILNKIAPDNLIDIIFRVLSEDKSEIKKTLNEFLSNSLNESEIEKLDSYFQDYKELIKLATSSTSIPKYMKTFGVVESKSPDSKHPEPGYKSLDEKDFLKYFIFGAISYMENMAQKNQDSKTSAIKSETSVDSGSSSSSSLSSSYSSSKTSSVKSGSDASSSSSASVPDPTLRKRVKAKTLDEKGNLKTK